MKRPSAGGILLLYNYGVILSTAYLTTVYGITDRWTLLVLAFVFAVFWTMYFRISILDKVTPASEAGDGSE